MYNPSNYYTTDDEYDNTDHSDPELLRIIHSFLTDIKPMNLLTSPTTLLDNLLFSIESYLENNNLSWYHESSLVEELKKYRNIINYVMEKREGYY